MACLTTHSSRPKIWRMATWALRCKPQGLELAVLRLAPVQLHAELKAFGLSFSRRRRSSLYYLLTYLATCLFASLWRCQQQYTTQLLGKRLIIAP